MLRPRNRGDSRHAFVTFLMRNDSYLAGALVLAHALRRQRTCADLVCLVTPDISRAACAALGALYDHVIGVESFFLPHQRRHERQDRPYLFTRFHALRLGRGGGLGFGYEKVVLLDADLLPLRGYDRLFRLRPPAGIINEKKANFIEVDRKGHRVVPPDVRRSRQWCWHRRYGSLCPHGSRIPREFTDRVRRDPGNLGVHGALLIVRPDRREYDGIRRDVRRPEIRRLVTELFSWPEMQYITLRWSGRWRSVDPRYCGLSGYPTLDVLEGTHFAGVKPWQLSRRKPARHFARYPDFQRCYREYRAMLTSHPELRRFGRLRALLRAIDDLRRTG